MNTRSEHNEATYFLGHHIRTPSYADDDDHDHDNDENEGHSDELSESLLHEKNSRL